MSSIAVSSIVLACVFGGALFGMFLAKVLPEDHLSPQSIDLVKLGMGLVATMTAMVLGLILASAKASYDTERGELTALSANIVLLDRVLAHYGPDSKGVRDRLRATIEGTLDRDWSEGRSRHPRSGPAAGSEVLYDKIQELSPGNDEQRSTKSQALNIMTNIGGTRWLMLEQEANSISMPLLIVVVCWLTVIFISFGLFAPRNATVVATLFICALSVSTAIFLILELYTPFEGFIRISDTPLRNALTHLGL
jgi:hypothetical protein